MKRDYVTIGGFEMTCSTMRAPDPSYDDTIWCYKIISDCVPSNWEAAVSYNGDSAVGRGVTLLAIRHTGSLRTFAKCNQVWVDKQYIHYKTGWEICDLEVGVDSGQAGLFDDAYYHDDSVVSAMPEAERDFDTPWYNHCCDQSLGERQAGVIPYGAVAYCGDGSYTTLQHKNEQGQVDCAVILFLPEEKKRRR